MKFNLPDINVVKGKEPKGIFCWLYENKEKSVCCFGVHHERGFTSQMKKIIDVYKQYQPDCVIVEGYKQRIKDKDFSDLSVKLDESFEGNESLLGINLALQNNIPVYSCEPTDIEELKEMLDIYPPDELLAFYSFRGAGIVTTDISKKDNKDETEYDLFYERYKKVLQILNPEYNPDRENIFNIYKKWFGKELHELSSLEQNRYVWPTSNELKWQRSNDISKISSKTRNNIIIENLFNLLEKHKKVFIIYGKSHLPVWDDALKDFFQMEGHKIIFEQKD